MPIVHVQDKGGDTITYRKVGDVMFTPVFPEDVLLDVPKLKMRDDDVLIVDWVRSGTHWMWELVSMLTNNNTETIPKYKEEHMFEYQPGSVLDNLPSPRILNTHLLCRHLPEDMKSKRCKFLYLLRDPRDAMVSWYKFMIKHLPFEYSGKWENWLPLQLEGKVDWGSWFDHVRDWEKVFETNPNLDVHFWHYEDMIENQVKELCNVSDFLGTNIYDIFHENPVEELRKISKFLGTQTTDSMLKAIAEKCHIDRMRRDKYQYELKEVLTLHYHEGKTGSWKTLFTVQQYEEFEKIYREKMKGSRFENRYKGPVATL